jgi:hypothetical protein
MSPRLTPDDLYERIASPALATPVMFVALDGWVDAGAVLERVLGALCERPSVVVAEFDTDLLMHYRERRPIARIDGGINIGVDWPRIQLLATHDLDGGDVLILRGPEPDLLWQRFTEAVLDLAQALRVRLVVPVGAYPAAVPHTRTPRLSATGTTPVLVEQIGFIRGRVEVPAGIHAALERASAARGIPSVGVWATVPHYAAAEPYPAAAAALLTGLATLTERRFDPTALLAEADGVGARLDAMVESSEDLAALVAHLEQRTDQASLADAGLPTGEQLAAEFQRLLGSDEA